MWPEEAGSLNVIRAAKPSPAQRARSRSTVLSAPIPPLQSRLVRFAPNPSPLTPRPASLISFAPAPPPPPPTTIRAARGASSSPLAPSPSSLLLGTHTCRERHYTAARGLFRVFNAAGYRFYRSQAGPPAEGSTPFATATSLPATPADTFADGVWYLSVSYFNGVLDSGFLPVGQHGETYLRLEVDGGEQLGNAPAGPTTWHLEQRPSGIVRVVAMLMDTSTAPPDEWSIAYTLDGSDPAEDTTDISPEIPAGLGAYLAYDLPAQPHGTIVRVRLQTRRNDGTEETPSWVYSDNSEIKTTTAAADGPTAPLSLERWPGRVED